MNLLPIAGRPSSSLNETSSGFRLQMVSGFNLARHWKIRVRSEGFLCWIPKISELLLDEMRELLFRVIRENQDLLQPNE
jgi:hypothetical protein